MKKLILFCCCQGFLIFVAPYLYSKLSVFATQTKADGVVEMKILFRTSCKPQVICIHAHYFINDEQCSLSSLRNTANMQNLLYYMQSNRYSQFHIYTEARL